MAADDNKGAVDKVKDAAEAAADKIEPGEGEGPRGAGGTTGDSEAIQQAPTS